jgi:uncharacterized protein (TIGR02996 family)
VTGRDLLNLVLDELIRLHQAYEYGPFRCVVPVPLRRLMDSDYYPSPYLGKTVAERIKDTGVIRGLYAEEVPVVIIVPDDDVNSAQDEEMLLACRVLQTDPTARGVYRGLDHLDPTPWLVFADRLEELGCPAVAAKVREQHSLETKEATA